MALPVTLVLPTAIHPAPGMVCRPGCSARPRTTSATVRPAQCESCCQAGLRTSAEQSLPQPARRRCSRAARSNSGTGGSEYRSECDNDSASERAKSDQHDYVHAKLLAEPVT